MENATPYSNTGVMQIVKFEVFATVPNEVVVTPSSQELLLGESFTFSAEVLGKGKPDQTVIWSIEGNEDEGTTISEDGVLTISESETVDAEIIVIATSVAYPEISGTATVTLVKPPETPVFSVGGNLSDKVSASPGGTVTFTVTATVSDDGTLTYQWYKGDAAIDGATEASFTIEDLTTGDNGNYKVIVTNTKGGYYAEASSNVCTLTVTSAPGGSGGGPTGSGTPTTEEPEEPEEPEIPLASLFPFTDVVETNWFYDNVYYMWENSLMNGTSATLFSPNGIVTRGMVVTVLYRMEGEPDVSDLENPFDDVAEGKYFTEAVIWAAENGVVLGYGGGKYGPDDNVTREQLAAILYRYQQFTEKIPPGDGTDRVFADANIISEYARIPVQTLVVQGIINGKDNNMFDPKGNATRAEYAAMLNRYLVAIAE